ncbi:hypothetical protein FCM35_KLT14987 [Carex littledalei]|uniref:DUF4220 domain-containing protein n=1 Tax=Carex littledalei TaxID=544730 RepID=A0A833QCR6_9POAL|nr:hypothetical protein FCM35_KLT14987 [Carex littledalei]
MKHCGFKYFYSCYGQENCESVIYTCLRLALIEALVLLTAALMVVRYILDMFRRRSSSPLLLFFLIMLATLPYALLDYTIGLMQLTKSNNDVYQVWAVVLITLRYSIRAVRPSGIYGKQNPLQDMMSSLWTANLLGTRATMLKIPLWLLWSLNSVRIILGFADTELISTRHRRHMRLLTEYMRTEHEHPPAEDCNAEYMKGYKYLVRGEDKQKVKSDPPEYRVRLKVTKEKKFITTNKVWEQKSSALLGEPNESNKLKDLCLAFALFKLLRRRFFGLPIHEAKQRKTKEFVLKGLLQENKYDRAFQIIEAELAFLNDFFFTRYAVMFARGFPFLRLVLSLSVIGVASFLTLIFRRSSHHLEGDLSETIHGIAITRTLLAILAFKEIWEMLTYVISDWTKVVLISNYVQNPWWTRCPAIVAPVKYLCKWKIGKRWHGHIWQYNLLQSFQYFRWSHHPLYTFIRLVLYRKLPGYKGNYRIRLLDEVKSAISESLKYLCNHPEDLGKYLSTAANSIHAELEQKIPLTSKFATETKKILVWHMATCYCEIDLAETSKNTSIFSSLTSPFLLKNLDSLDEGLQSHYTAATALSQYSAHLVALRSPLVPDRSLVATKLFRSTVVKTLGLLRSCRSRKEVLLELDNLADENDDDDDDDEDIIILKNGVRLGRSLLKEIKTDTKLWKFLEKFWAGYLLYLAANVGPDGHKESLSRGGEFLTHLWALLTHAGIFGKTRKDPPVALRNLEVDPNEQIYY